MTGATGRPLKLAAIAVALLALTGCETAGLMQDGSMHHAAAYKADDRARELRLAAAARAAGQYDSALAIYRTILNVEPTASDVRAELAELHFEQGRHARAIAAFDAALADASPPPGLRAKALVGRGRALLATGRPAAAERDFVDALNLMPNDATALNGRGVAADMQGRHRDAQTLYRAALAYEPGNERVRSNLGLSLALAARFDEAVAELAPLATAADRAPRARHNLALAFGLMGRDDQARQLVDSDLAPAAAAGNLRFYDAIRSAVAQDAALAPPAAENVPQAAAPSAPRAVPARPAEPIAMAPAAEAAPADQDSAWPALDRIFALGDGEKQVF